MINIRSVIHAYILIEIIFLFKLFELVMQLTKIDFELLDIWIGFHPQQLTCLRCFTESFTYFLSF
jgi:hypothetical protein